MGITAKKTYHKNGTFDLNISCDVSGLPLDQVDPKFGMHCSDPNCKCLAESKAVSPALDAFMDDMMKMFPPNIGEDK